MKKTFLSTDEVSECAEIYTRISDGLCADFEQLQRIIQLMDNENKDIDELTGIKQKIKSLTTELNSLRNILRISLKRYIDTESEIFTDIQRKLFFNSGAESINDIILERKCECSEGSLISNHTLSHEEWLTGMILDEACEK